MIYNEQIRDLLEPSGHLDIRSDPCNGISVHGLSVYKPQTASELLNMLERGNKNRIQHPTDVNATSSRSHAVFQVMVEQRPRSADFSTIITKGKMLLIDLAGSERALVTTNRGIRLKEGANINKSLLALGNCINALASATDKTHVSVTYRNSKLTRLLKDSLGGNCRTVMIVNISPSSLNYEETYNSLKYADRAKHIKTKLVRNVVNIDFHLSNYRQIVEQLQKEVLELKEKLTAKRGNSEEFESAVAARFEGEANSVFAERMRLRKEMAEHDASEQDANFKLTCREHDIEYARIVKASKGRTTKLESKVSSLRQFLGQVEHNKQSVHQSLLHNNKELNKLQVDINSVTMDNPRSTAATKRYLDKLMEQKRLETECSQQRRQLKYCHKLLLEHDKEAQKTERMLLLALEIIAEVRPTSGKAKEKCNSLMRLVEGEKEVAWADQSTSEHQHSSSMLLQSNKPFLDTTEDNISPAFLQSSGILTLSHNMGGPHDTIVECCEDDVDSERSPLYDKTGQDNEGNKHGFITKTLQKSPECLTTGSPLHCHGDDVTPVFCHWAKRTPVAMEMDNDRDVTRTLSMNTSLASVTTKIPKSPHPQLLQKSHKILPSSLATTKHTITPAANHHPPTSRTPVSAIKKDISMTTEKKKKAATTPKHRHDNSHKNTITLTPGSRQPFVNFPPIFAPTLVRSKSSSTSPSSDPSSSSNDSPPSQPSYHTTCTPVDESIMMGFDDNFVPFNNTSKDLSPNTTECNRTYHIEENNGVSLRSLNSTYTRALSELEQDQIISDKMVARKVGQEIWQKVKSEDNTRVRPHNSQPLTSVQCNDEQHTKKLPGYLNMTTSAAIKRLPSSKQLPPSNRPTSNKENNPAGRRRVATAKHSTKTLRPLGRSASMKSRPLVNW
ncbi:uncharacterized protein [Dysidea avara]|uniref:uncharacterized protein isoform X2 n=1 Tax=Dysidea avara TaxID=196820 RepID=UPI003320A44B